MQLITSHLNTDFDSLASMVAVRKLYPDAVICPPGSMNRRVRDFVNRHGHMWNIMKPSKIPLERVTLMVVVDTRSRLRIGPFAALAGRQEVEVHIYDHHPPTIDDIPASVARCESIGATTTMIVERLSRERKSVSPEEATLFAMGIYDDTGALTYEATTDRDIAALGRLRQMGADLSMILSREGDFSDSSPGQFFGAYREERMV
jgi:tRNA nucleotidyltransferase (CCA-adding enzyme)